ncbi:MAG: LuxR C-terminal-related transcriptional regulator [Solirubrobacteraceae bacterium]
MPTSDDQSKPARPLRDFDAVAAGARHGRAGQSRRHLMSVLDGGLLTVVSLPAARMPIADQAEKAPAAGGELFPRHKLFERLEGARRVTRISAPAGSGKTVLLRSWLGEAGLGDSAAWVSVGREQRDPQQFWISVADGLRETAAGSTLVRGLTAAPELDVEAIVERLLEDLGGFEDPVWVVIDDLHELESSDVLRQLELFLMRAPAELRFMLSTRHELRLGLHRLRLEGELTEVRAADLRFTRDEARTLFEAAGVQLSESALGYLHERTEGWAAGLRLAALSLAGHPDPERFAAEFSGSERTVAEYLIAEVLERQPEDVRRLLLRTSILERMSGPLADVVSGGGGAERSLQELEEGNAFVVSLDARRSWFRYHRLFSDLLQLELRRTAPEEISTLHDAAAEWFAEHGHPIDAVRHAQAAQNWVPAARLLSDHWTALYLHGRSSTASEVLTAFPSDFVAADPELTALMAANSMRDSLEEAERYLARAIQGSESVPAARRGPFRVKLAIYRLWLAQLRGDLPAAVQEAERLLAPAEATDAAQFGRDEELSALAMQILGVAELWAGQVGVAQRHLERAVALAHRINCPVLEISGLAHLAIVACLRSFTLGAERGTQAIELARRHGWSEEPCVAVAYVALGAANVWRGRLGEAESWLGQAERTLPPQVQRAAGLLLHATRGMLELGRGRDGAALRAFQAAERQAELLATPYSLATWASAHVLVARVRLGQTERVERALAEFDDNERETGEIRTVIAVLRLAQDDPDAATTALAPVLDGSVPKLQAVWLVQAFLLEAIARDALADAGAAERALETALDLAEPDGLLLPFLLHQTPAMLERHCRHRTTHASLIAEILNLQAGRKRGSALKEAERLQEPLSESETRVLRYLPTNLSKPEIADELYVSVNTVKAHMRHLYAKLGVTSRREAVERARALSLLAPSSGKR